MPTFAFIAVSLISRGSGPRTAPAPLGAVAQRPLVLARPPHVPRQLSLFSPPGGRR
ncbi:MAG: hypothetical protein ABIQ33_12565 [Caldimonas sp.]